MMHRKEILTNGKELTDAIGAVIMLHGRGASAEDIIGLASYLSIREYAVIAPQATHSSWYPFSFLAPPSQNEPWLSSALSLLSDIVKDIGAKGIPDENIFFTGFSQGACLALEFVTRHARKWGGVAAFTGGLIGDRIYEENYAGDFGGTRIFIGSADPDAHVPVQRVHDTTRKLQSMNASVLEKLYPGMGHTVTEEEITLADQWIFGKK